VEPAGLGGAADGPSDELTPASDGGSRGVSVQASENPVSTTRRVERNNESTVVINALAGGNDLEVGVVT
jgi:hypothetical protein